MLFQLYISCYDKIIFQDIYVNYLSHFTVLLLFNFISENTARIITEETEHIEGRIGIVMQNKNVQVDYQILLGLTI